jgi:hypothetical protein
MNLDFDFTEQDLVDFSVHHHVHSPAQRRITWGGYAVIAVAGVTLWLVLLLHVGLTEVNARKFGPLLLTIPIVWGIYRLSFRFNLKHVVREMLDEAQNRGLLGKKHLELTPREITVSDGQESQSTRWQAVERIEESSDAIYIYYGSMEAILIPRRAFPSDEAWKGCAKTARAYFADAHRD